MAPVLGILFVSILVGTVAYFVRRMSVKSDAAWKQVTDYYDLTRVEGTWKRGRYYEGDVRGEHVVLDTYTVSTGKSSQTFTRVAIALRGVSRDLKVHREDAGAKIAKFFGGQDIDTGDAAFDAQFRVRHATPGGALAALDERARKALLATYGRNSIKLENGSLVLTRGGVPTDPAALKEMIEDAVRIASTMRDTVDTCGRLVDLVLHDSCGEVRFRALSELDAQFSADARTAEALRAALEDRRPENAALAAILAGPAGGDVLARVLASPADLPQDLLVRALRAFAVYAEPDKLAPVLAGALANDAAPKAQAAAVDLASQKKIISLKDLIANAAKVGDKEIALRAMRAMLLFGGADTEDFYLSMLDRDDEKMRLAACDALKQCGTVRSVEKLLPLTEGIFSDGDVKRAARAAVDRIQSRLVGADAGRLSVADSGSAGAVSISEAAAERLRDLPKSDAAGTASGVPRRAAEKHQEGAA